MATITVTTQIDEAFDDLTGGAIEAETNDGDGLSLREAIGLASDGDIIEFDLGVETTIRLSAGLGEIEIEIATSLTIDGGGLITITGDDTVEYGVTDVAASAASDALDDNIRIFSTTAPLTIDGLTLTGGRTIGIFEEGGAVYTTSDLTIVNSTIAGNSTAGQFSDGGGVLALGDVTVTNSIVLGNVALNADGNELFESTVSDADGLIEVVGNNIIGDDSEAFDLDDDATGAGSVQHAAAADVFAAATNNNDVDAGVLADNGGAVLTVALSSDAANPALDATISATSSDLDARGLPRDVGLAGVDNGGTSDLGAFELQIDEDDAPPHITSSATFSVAERASSALSLGPVTATGLTGVTFSIAGGVDAGAVSIDAAAGVLSQEAAPDFEAPIDADGDNVLEVLVRATDENGNAATQALTITVTDVSEAPAITSGATFSAVENQTAAGLVTASDDRTAVTFAITGGADAGLFNVDGTTGALTFTSAPDFEAPDDAGGDNAHEIEVTATDGGCLTSTQALTITVTDVNEAPVAAAASATGDEDREITGVLTASDVDGDALSFAVVEGPSNGAVTVNANGSFQFTPVAGFNGSDSFVFSVSDGALSDTATATLTVNPVDDPVVPVEPVDLADPPSTVRASGDETVLGTSGNDEFDALAGEDDVTGLGGDDLLFGRSGDDIIRGSAGDDTLRGDAGDNTLRGDGGEDNIKDGADADMIRGNRDDDAIQAGGGADEVKGGAGADMIFGGAGADTLSGDGGDDTLMGNGGADVFQFRTTDSNDTISDFSQGQDRVEIQDGATSFADLIIEQDGDDVLIGFGAGKVRVVTGNAEAFDESDFIF
ncbi:MAG: Ig-like domain-containing protein [Pseudomonadota bacterium]